MDGKLSSQFPELPLNHDEASTSHSGANVHGPAIFLSHSGKQKNFVEHLFNALKIANHTKDTVFFDKHSLPKGSPFPNRIREAALSCRLGVVIISDDFFTSKWPMSELEMLVLRKGPNPQVLPVCYKLNFEELKSPSNISKWRSKWMEMEGGEHVDEWEKAVRALALFNGEVFTLGMSEITYIEKVVRHICSLVPCPVLHDMSLIQGHDRLAKEIARMFGPVEASSLEESGFDHVAASCPEDSISMVGLHGVGGSGKTTLCSRMVDYYTSQYMGRSCLIEFPFDGDKSKIVEACMHAVRKLSNFSNHLHLDEVDSFDKVIPLMMNHVKRCDMFLAIDNVWENSLEAARRLLGVGFSAKSKILLTSRSEQVLRVLLMQHTNKKWRVDQLPTPEHEEAFQIFQNIFDPVNPNSLVDTKYQIAELLEERCRFGGIYHPLALTALARYTLRRVSCMYESLENGKPHLLDVLKQITNADLHQVEDVIKLSYTGLPNIRQHMFLDIALFFVPQVDSKFHIEGEKRSTILCYLRHFYTELEDTQISTHVDDLAFDGLIQVEACKDGTGKRIRVHDLYSELAKKEAANSCRFLVTGATTSGEELERVLLQNEETQFFDKVGSKKCVKLRVVEMSKVTIRSGMHLDGMPVLRVLRLNGVICETQRTFRVIKLNALVQLRALKVESCGFVEKITGLDALPELRHLEVLGCPRVRKLEGVSGLIRLEELYVAKCVSLKTLSVKGGKHSGSLSPSLQHIRVVGCGALEKVPDVGGLMDLQTLVLQENRALEVEVGGEYLTSTLKVLQIYGCKSVRRFPSLDKCVHLETLFASQGIVNNSLLLGKLPNLRELQLEDSDWSYGDRFNAQWKHITLLQHLAIDRCGSIEKLEVGCLMNSLKVLRVRECIALEEIGDLSGLHCLEELDIRICPRLKVVGGLEGISAQLKRWVLRGCRSLEQKDLVEASAEAQRLGWGESLEGPGFSTEVLEPLVLSGNFVIQTTRTYTYR